MIHNRKLTDPHDVPLLLLALIKSAKTNQHLPQVRDFLDNKLPMSLGGKTYYYSDIMEIVTDS